jgi:nucleoside phosphorylase
MGEVVVVMVGLGGGESDSYAVCDWIVSKYYSELDGQWTVGKSKGGMVGGYYAYRNQRERRSINQDNLLWSGSWDIDDGQATQEKLTLDSRNHRVAREWTRA